MVQIVEQQAKTLQSQLQSGEASIKWIGNGLISGDMVDMELTNTSSNPQTFRFVPGLVLQDPGQAVRASANDYRGVLHEACRGGLPGPRIAPRDTRGVS